MNKATKITVKLSKLEVQYRLCLSTVQTGLWYEMFKEKIIVEYNTYLKTEWMRFSEHMTALSQEYYKKGKDFYPMPDEMLLSVVSG